MILTLPALPFDESDLVPHISAETLHYHYGKHHKAYVDKANSLIALNPEFECGGDIVKIVRAAHANDANVPLFNNAAQAFNHDFYWKSMTKSSGEGKGAVNPSENSPLMKMIKSYSKKTSTNEAMEVLTKDLHEAALNQFGSGWGWLVYDKEKKVINVIKESNAGIPIVTESLVPLLTVDVWEHAYYIDRRNARAEYLNIFFSQLVNWKFAEENLNDVLEIKQA